ncbi:hypothetical protein [Devosia aurantiaca]|uniref:Uncharacterized protein n=1 Tax=Devosia aurantiaca TaxID=2714858 RepID=A0A6M1SI56_9HYPH|nr:hypothetical protein [Devosia aurantiaca]NGP16534.1 hypothetical protein [Devosia aurantiaca]
MLSILERLAAVHENLGEEAFHRACHKVRHAIAQVVLVEAERLAEVKDARRKRAVNHNKQIGT